MNGTITAIRRFPVKGMTAEPLDAVTLAPGEGLPGDRAWGFLRAGHVFEGRPLQKDRFVVLQNEAGMARLATRLVGTDRLIIADGDREQTFDLAAAADRNAAAAFVADRLGLPDRPTLIDAGDGRFTDVAVVSPALMNAVSILSRASVDDLAAAAGVAVDPRRFRMNVEVEGWPPWAELETVDRTLTLGTMRLRVLLRTRRCAATEVDPDTATRDLNVPVMLRRQRGHLDMGIYAEVIEGGTLRVGDRAVFEPG
ncbi:MAG: MOSC domain-containing protein [Pseudomonadota bacterium]